MMGALRSARAIARGTWWYVPVLCIAGLPASLAADKPRVERPYVSFGVHGSATDNIFQEEESLGTTRDSFTTFELEAMPEIRLPAGNKLVPGLELRHVLYRETSPADYTEGQASLEWKRGKTRLRATYLRSPHRLLFITDLGEEVVYEKDSWFLRLRQGLGERVLLDARAGIQEEEFEAPEEDRTNTGRSARLACSVKIVAPFRPRLGVIYDREDSVDPAENHSYRRSGGEAGAEGDLGRHMRYLARLRYTRTEYLGTDAGESNFEREDERRDAFLEFQFPVEAGWTFRIGGTHLVADSTRKDRNFTATEGWAAVTWEF